MNKCPHCNAKIYSSVATRCSNCHLKISISDSDIKAINLHKYDNLNKFIGYVLAVFICFISIILINAFFNSNQMTRLITNSNSWFVWILRMFLYGYVIFMCRHYFVGRNYIKTKQQKL